MKIRRLSEIDLAQFAAIADPAQLERALRGYSAGGGSWSYEPARASTPDIVHARVPLHGELARVPWEKISAQIAGACRRGEAQVQSNKEVGKLLFDFSNANKWNAVKYPMGQMPIGVDDAVKYWSNVVIDYGDGPFVPFFDHRRKNGISSESERQIVFSMQNSWVRERHPDLKNSRLALVSFPPVSGGRQLKIQFHCEEMLLSYDQLNERVRIVYEMWARILRERPRSVRGTGTDGQTSWDF